MIQLFFPIQDKIRPINERKQQYKDRCAFFRDLFDINADDNGHAPNNRQNRTSAQTLVGMDEINRYCHYWKAIQMAQQNPQHPSLFHFKYYLLPALIFDEQSYNDNILQNVNNMDREDFVLNIIDVLTDDNPITNPSLVKNTLNINQFKIVDDIPQIDQRVGDFTYYSHYNIKQTVLTILEYFYEQKVEKVIFNLEVLYSDLQFIEFSQINRPMYQKTRQNLIRYQRAFAVIDQQIIQTNDRVLIEQQQFIYSNNNQFTLRVDLQEDQQVDQEPVQWKKINYNYTFVKQGQQGDMNQNFVLQVDITLNQEQQQIDFVNRIYSQIIDLQENHYDAIHPTFIRYIDVYAIKEYTLTNQQFPSINMVRPRDQQQVWENDGVEEQLHNFLNGMIAFDYDKDNKINEYDIVNKNDINLQQHCLLRILFYFEKLQNQELDQNQFLLDVLEQQNQMNINIDFEKDPIFGLFNGSVRHLAKYIQKKYNIILNVYCYQSTRDLNPKNASEYSLLINKNHCILSKLDKIQNLKQKKNDNQYFSMLSKSNQQKKKLQPSQKKYQLKQDKLINRQIINYYIDFETFVLNEKGQQGVFLICIIDDYDNKQHFIELNCVQELINYFGQLYETSKEQDQICNIWSFNGGKFDYMFITPFLIQKFADLIFIIGSEIDIKQINIGENLYFKDIYQIFNNGNLKQQAKNWNIVQQKQDFEIQGWTLEKYRDPIYQQRVIEYCYQDCIVLKEIVNKFYFLINHEFQNNKYNTFKNKYDITKIFSASTLTMNIFKSFYLNFDLISSKKRDIYKIERDSYYGGITMNFKKSGQNLYYYDINSSYPNVMRNCKIPIQPLSKIEQIYKPSEVYGLCLDNDQYNLNIMNEFDLYEIELEFIDQVIIPFLPTKTNDGLIYLKHVTKSWRWGCEILFCKKWGIIKSIKIHNIIKYKGDVIFKDFINDLYIKRQQAKKDKRQDLDQFYKILMNSLYGKFGQKQFPFTKYVQEVQLEENLRNPLIENIKNIDFNTYKISLSRNNHLNFQGALVRIASFITAKARINLMEGIYQVGQENVYYCDTDSITTSKQLDQNMIGDELGQWKLECFIKEGIFIAPKIYYIKLDQPDDKGKTEHKKCKGINQKSLTNELFQQLKNDQLSTAQNKSVFKRGFGEVIISDQQKIIRIKDLKRQWIDDQHSIPYNNLFEYEQDKLIKEEQNEEVLFKNQLIKKNLNQDQIKQMMNNKYSKQYQSVLNNNDIINQKRKQQYLNNYQNENEYLQFKCQ